MEKILDELVREFVDSTEKAEEEFYDSVFYASGKYEFDETNKYARYLMGKLIVDIGHNGRSSPVKFSDKLIPENGIYKDPAGNEKFLPQNVADRICRRKAKELRCEKTNGTIYMPTGKESKGLTVENYLYRAKNAYMIAAYRARSTNCQPYKETSFDRFINSLQRQWGSFSSGMKIFTIVFIVFVLIYSLGMLL